MVTCTRCTCPRCSPQLPERLQWRPPRFTLPAALPEVTELDLLRVAIRHASSEAQAAILIASIEQTARQYEALGMPERVDAMIAEYFAIFSADDAPARMERAS